MIKTGNINMNNYLISYQDFLIRVFVMKLPTQFKVLDSNNGNVLYQANEIPYSTEDGEDAFFQELYNNKKELLSL